MNAKQIATVENKTQLDSYIYCLLLFVVLLQGGGYQYYQRKYVMKKGTPADGGVSMMKLTKFIMDNIGAIIYSEYPGKVFRNCELDEQTMYYCRYEIRHDRTNFCQKMAS